MNRYCGRCCLGVVVRLASVWPAPAWAQIGAVEPVGSDQSEQVSDLTNADVISLLQSGLGPDTVIAVIQKRRPAATSVNRG